MRKGILFSIIILVLISYVTMQAVDSISNEATCMRCHDLNHREDPEYLSHKNLTIGCIDCHSGSGIRGYVEARKELTWAILSDKALTALNYIFPNSSDSKTAIHMLPDCTKCHLRVKGRLFNHSNLTGCIGCHTMNRTSEQYEKSFWMRMGTGGHRNKTCRDCHYTDFQIPSCTTCHKTHRKDADWNNSECLACHDSPHVPVRDGKFSQGIPKENCGACHSRVYEKLTFYNRRHNQLNSCVNCHPGHKEKKKCFECHVGDHTSHPFAQDNCGACHGKADCDDCHRDPHAPLKGLPRIDTKEQFNNYADTAKNH